MADREHPLLGAVRIYRIEVLAGVGVNDSVGADRRCADGTVGSESPFPRAVGGNRVETEVAGPDVNRAVSADSRRGDAAAGREPPLLRARIRASIEVAPACMRAIVTEHQPGCALTSCRPATRYHGGANHRRNQYRDDPYISH